MEASELKLVQAPEKPLSDLTRREMLARGHRYGHWPCRRCWECGHPMEPVPGDLDCRKRCCECGGRMETKERMLVKQLKAR